MASNRRLAVTVVAAAATGAIAMIAGVAVAGSTSNVIHACANKKTGALRLSKKCNRGTETRVVWNVQGPPGKPGTNGTNGTNGAPGISGYQIVQSSSVSNPHGQQTLVTAICPSGKKAIAGGGGGSSALPDQSINSSFPGGDGSQWNVEENNSSASSDYTAYAIAICAKVAG